MARLEDVAKYLNCELWCLWEVVERGLLRLVPGHQENLVYDSDLEFYLAAGGRKEVELCCANAKREII